MKLFEISQTETQLRLDKRRAPQFWRAGLLLGLLAFFGGVCWQSIHQLRGFDAFFAVGTACLGFAVVALQAIAPLLTVVRGDNWVFDRDEDVLFHNGKRLEALSQTYAVRIWEEDDGEETTRRLAIQLPARQPLLLSDAHSQSEWQELIAAAQQISDFTGIKLVRK